MATKHKQATKIWLVLLGVLAGVVVLEIGARLWLERFATQGQVERYGLYTDIAGSDFQYSPHPYLNYYPTPGYEDGLRSHNDLGFRGDPFPLEKPPGEFRIVVLGGSTTYTSVVEDNRETFPARLGQILQEQYGQDAVRVINAGVPGYTSWESLANLAFRVIALNPDLVVVYHGTNDVHARIVLADSYSSDNTGKVRAWSPPGVPWFEHSAILRLISRRMGITRQVALGDFIESDHYRAPRYVSRSYDPQDLDPENFEFGFLKDNPPVYFEQNLRSMVALAREHGFDILLASWAHSPHFDDYAATPLYRQGFRENNATVARVSAETGAHFFDFAAEMPQDPDYWADGRHVNALGALVKAELFAEFIVWAGLLGASSP
jgi:lysophospholipase L1-like esterase